MGNFADYHSNASSQILSHSFILDVDPPPFGTFISKSALSAAKCQIGVTLNDPKGRRAFEVYLCREFPNHFCKKGLIDSEVNLAPTLDSPCLQY